MGMGVAVDEQETHINWSREEGCAYVYTSDRTTMTKLDRLCREHPENYKCTNVGRAMDDGTILTKEYSIADKTLVSFRGVKIKQELSEEQRAELSERMRRLHDAKLAQ